MINKFVFSISFFAQWGPDSHAGNWWAGAHPYALLNNQGVESENKQIKDDYSYREQMNMTAFVNLMERIIADKSLVDDSTLDGHRLTTLMPDRDGRQEKTSFNKQEEGWKYYKVPKVQKVVDIGFIFVQFFWDGILVEFMVNIGEILWKLGA